MSVLSIPCLHLDRDVVVSLCDRPHRPYAVTIRVSGSKVDLEEVADFDNYTDAAHCARSTVRTLEVD